MIIRLAAIMASEQVDVTLPAVVSVDGFFCTHARGPVKITPAEYKLPPRDGWRSAVPAMDNENPPARISREMPQFKKVTSSVTTCTPVGSKRFLRP